MFDCRYVDKDHICVVVDVIVNVVVSVIVDVGGRVRSQVDSTVFNTHMTIRGSFDCRYVGEDRVCVIVGVLTVGVDRGC
jgi:hypothetical protein